jgi:hypothetical protein
VYLGDTTGRFHGNPLTKTEVTYYDKAKVPDQPAAVLVSDMWGLFEWAQRMAREVDFELLSDARSLNIFVEDFIELKQHGSGARHRALFGFRSWNDVVDRYRARGGVERIDKMLRDGYSTKDWQQTAAKLGKRTTSGYALGSIEDVRNREFPSVMLAPDIVDWVRDTRDIAPAASAVYVAVTRAQRRLIIPRRLRSWIEEISRK